MVLGVLRRKLWLDKTIEHLASARSRSWISQCVALEIGLYQLRFLTRVPAAAAVNESVNFVRASRVKSAAGFVNAVLRRATREPDLIRSLRFPIRSRNYRSRLRSRAG